MIEEIEEVKDGEHFALEVRDILQACGADLNQKRDLSLYLYLPTEGAAKSCSSRIVTHGISCEVSEADYETDGWLCYCTVAVVPSMGELSRIGSLMIELAENHGGDFDGWQDESGVSLGVSSLMEVDYSETAVSLLESVKANFAPSHNYVVANPSDFNVDMDYYDECQGALEKIGFDFVADLEDRTITEQGGVMTFTRIMTHPGSCAVGAIVYVDEAETPEIYEFETALSDGRFVTSTIAPQYVEMADWPRIHAYFLPEGTSLEELYLLHLEHVAQVMERSPGAKPVFVRSREDAISMANESNQHKHDYLESIGWVTEEWLIAQVDGDIETGRAIYAAVREIVERVVH